MSPKDPEIPVHVSWFAIEQLKGWLAAQKPNEPKRTPAALAREAQLSKPTVNKALETGGTIGERAAIRVAANIAHMDWTAFQAEALRRFKAAKASGLRVEYAGGENRKLPSTAVGNHPSFERQWDAALAHYGALMQDKYKDLVAGVSGSFGMLEELPVEFLKGLHDAVAMAEAAKARAKKAK